MLRGLANCVGNQTEGKNYSMCPSNPQDHYKWADVSQTQGIVQFYQDSMIIYIKYLMNNKKK